MKQRNSIWNILGLAVLSIAILTGCANKTVAAQPDATPTAVVIVEKDGTLMAEGEVVPARYVTLSFETSGVIEELLVEEGSTVESGQVLARLSGSEHLETAVAAAEFELLSAQQALDDIFENAEARKAEAQMRLAKAEKAYDDAQEEVEKIDMRYGDQDAIDQAYAAYVLAENRVKDAQWWFDQLAHLADDNEDKANALSQLAAARSTRDRAKIQWEYVKSAPDEFEVNETQSEVEVALAELEAARREWEKLKEDGLDPDEIELAEARIKNTEVQLAAARASLDDVIFKAPFNGTVIASDLKVGEFVSPGQAALTLADTSVWKIETTDLTEYQVTGVQTGMDVNISLEAIPELELNGSVERIKALGVDKQGDITYTVIIALDEMDERLLWNMTTLVTFES